MVWWGYQVGGYYTPSPLMAKAMQFPALLMGKPQASIITLATTCRQFQCESELEELNAGLDHQAMLEAFTRELQKR